MVLELKKELEWRLKRGLDFHKWEKHMHKAR